GAARALSVALDPGTTLVVSSSMPVRDLEWYGGVRSGLRVLANRGANGIDGVVSTAAGVAAGAGGATALLVGDLAFLYDVNGLLGLAGAGLDLAIVVLDNDGGGIFSLLPQAQQVAPDRFEQLFGTPHGLDLVAVARAYGIAATRVDDAHGLRAAVAPGVGGARMAVVTTDRSSNAALHREIHAEVAAALPSSPP
nr:thiamine pyrophosphate-dependent enzyme [Actinomycetota bacterium]